DRAWWMWSKTCGAGRPSATAAGIQHLGAEAGDARDRAQVRRELREADAVALAATDRPGIVDPHPRPVGRAVAGHADDHDDVQAGGGFTDPQWTVALEQAAQVGDGDGVGWLG